MATKPLTLTQKRAASYLTDEWVCHYELKSKSDGCGLATFDALVRKGVARKRVEPGVGFAMMRSNRTFYKSTTPSTPIETTE